MASKRSSLKYQDYLAGISGLTADEQLCLLEVMAANLRHSIGANRQLHNIRDLEGLGSEIWQAHCRWLCRATGSRRLGGGIIG